MEIRLYRRASDAWDVLMRKSKRALPVMAARRVLKRDVPGAVAAELARQDPQETTGGDA